LDLQIEKPAAATGLDVIGLLVTEAPILPFSQIVPWLRHGVASAAPLKEIKGDASD